MPERMEVPIDQLDLDPENPRLPEGQQVESQDVLLKTMARDYSLIELGRSFVDNGYFQEEPLATVRDGERFKVVEGNRRLAALRLLSDSSLVESLGLAAKWRDLSVQWQEKGETTVPILVYDNRDEIIPFLGFRHISGIKRWEPKEKARFINSLLESRNLTFTQVARIVGSGTDNSVRDNYVAYRLFLQARDEFGLDTSRLEDRFGVLLRALSSAPVLKHLGIEISDRVPAELRRPLPDERQEELREIVEWIFGTEERNPVITDSRHITRLGFVLRKPDALEVLRTSGNFALAYGQTEGEEASLLENLRKASYHLDQVKRDIDRHAEKPLVREFVERCNKSLQVILRILGIQEGKG